MRPPRAAKTRPTRSGSTWRRRTAATRNGSSNAIGRGCDEAFGRNAFAMPVRDAHTRNRRRANYHRERFHSAVRRLPRSCRGLLTHAVPAVSLMYRNCLRLHAVPGGIAHVEKAGVLVPCPDRATALVQNAAMSDMDLTPRWTKNEKAARAVAA